jgi:hypothetical protein
MGRKGKNHRPSKADEPHLDIESRSDGITADKDLAESGQSPPLEEQEMPLTESGSFRAEDESIARLRRLIKNVQDTLIRHVLSEWMDTEGEEDQIEGTIRLAETLPAAILFSHANISSTTT